MCHYHCKVYFKSVTTELTAKDVTILSQNPILKGFQILTIKQVYSLEKQGICYKSEDGLCHPDLRIMCLRILCSRDPVPNFSPSGCSRVSNSIIMTPRT